MSNETDLQASVAAALSVEGEHRNRQARRYYELCDLRDAVYAKAQPIENELDAVNAQIQTLQAKATDLAQQIERTWGPNHLALKRSIRILAAELGQNGNRIPPRESLV
jgi:uncharacterized coiled-coil DUF342 family protein